MKKLLNTLYVMTENAYLSLDGENVVISAEGRDLGRVPLHTVDGVVSFGYVGASPAFMGKCAEYNKPLVFLTPQGRFLARVIGKQYGNILLRKKQFCLEESVKLRLAQNIIAAKLYNSSNVFRRAISDYSERLDCIKLQEVRDAIKRNSERAFVTQNQDILRGIEGESASMYFSAFPCLILKQQEEFVFRGRSRRPPLDNVNALLSFGYSLLTSMCVSALETVGLDPYLGVFHTERPGRCSLALDLEEEFRAYMVDRFVLSLINKKMLTASDFYQKENGAVLFTDEGKKAFITLWQERKKEVILHPYLKEKIEVGLLPYVQALLLSKYLRGDIDDYPPFLWK